jgi:hypothetical protein
VDRNKYFERFEEVEGKISQILIDLRESVLAEMANDITVAQKKPMCPSVGWKHFLKTFYIIFGTLPYDGFLYDIKDKLQFKTNESTKRNALELAEKGFMIVRLEKRPFVMKGMACEAWYGWLQITEKGEKVAKELL